MIAAQWAAQVPDPSQLEAGFASGSCRAVGRTRLGAVRLPENAADNWRRSRDERRSVLRGELAAGTMEAHLDATGGVMIAADLARAPQPMRSDTITTDNGGYTSNELRRTGQGIVALVALGIPSTSHARSQWIRGQRATCRRALKSRSPTRCAYVAVHSITCRRRDNP